MDAFITSLYHKSTMPASCYLLNATPPGLSSCEPYADRVKELVVKDAPIVQREEDVKKIMEDDGNNDDIRSNSDHTPSITTITTSTVIWSVQSCRRVFLLNVFSCLFSCRMNYWYIQPLPIYSI